jgi:hypothetical protein
MSPRTKLQRYLRFAERLGFTRDEALEVLRVLKEAR